MGELAKRIRAKYPEAYQDLSDADLEAKVVAKYPGVYDHLVTKPAAPPADDKGKGKVQKIGNYTVEVR